MSRTTTSTTTYQLVSFRYQEDPPGVIKASVPKEEWRIHPSSASSSSLRLVIEITKKEDSVFVSVLMKVLDGQDGSRSGLATLERLDLLDFSRPDVPKNPNPLKAIMGGKQIGFRYLHPLHAHSSMQHYKRFQLTFRNEEEASVAASSIQHVCPITNSSLGRTQAATTSHQPATESSKNTNTSMPRPPTAIRKDTSTIVGTGTNNESIDKSKTTALPLGPQNRVHTPTKEQIITPIKAFPSILTQNRPLRGGPEIQSPKRGKKRPASPRPPSPRPGSRSSPTRPSLSPSLNVLSSQLNVPFSQANVPSSQTNTFSQLHTLFSQADDSRAMLSNSNPAFGFPSPNPVVPLVSPELPASSRLSPASLPPSSFPVPSNPSSTLTSSGNPPALPESPLHSLPLTELEKMVIEVLHEPGFGELMEKLDKLWPLHGFLKT